MVKTNEELLEKYKDKNPRHLRVFIYYKHLVSGKNHEMNLWEWIRIQKDRRRRRDFEFIRVIDLDNYDETKNVSQEVPIEKDPCECPLCGFISKSENGLRTHKRLKHG